jgi:hypothetical protein
MSERRQSGRGKSTGESPEHRGEPRDTPKTPRDLLLLARTRLTDALGALHEVTPESLEEAEHAALAAHSYILDLIDWPNPPLRQVEKEILEGGGITLLDTVRSNDSDREV